MFQALAPIIVHPIAEARQAVRLILASALRRAEARVSAVGRW